MKRVGVIGSVNRDTIAHPNGGLTRSYGGILYTALALAYLGAGRIETWLLGKLGEDVAEEVMGLLVSCPSLRWEGVQIVPAANYHSQIHYHPDGRKEECLSGDIGPLSLESLAPFVPALDGVLINFITGFELELSTLIALRNHLPGPILMDVHSLTLGRAATGARFWRRPQDWETWVAQADVVQMNQEEAALLGELEGPHPSLLHEFARHLLRLGPRWAVVTRGVEGSMGWCREGEGEATFEQPAEAPEGARDPTGCGDVFLAGLGAGLFSGKDLSQAMALATRAAGLNSRLRGVETLARLAELHFG